MYEDGKFILTKRYHKCKLQVGDAAGSPSGHGYLKFMILGKKFYVHRLVWLWHHERFPENVIDHINQDTMDNRIENLRDVENHVNLRNRPQRDGAKYSKVRGVCYIPSANKPWQVQFIQKGRPTYRSWHAEQADAETVAMELGATTYAPI